MPPKRNTPGGAGAVRRGRWAEDLAASWLASRGMVLLDRNRRSEGGEIDLLARDGPCLVFVEVRCRRRGAWGGAAGSIGADKRRRLRACARGLLARREDLRWPGRTLRFDVVAIEFDEAGFALRHLRQVRV